jgi:hypothetical protein
MVRRGNRTSRGTQQCLNSQREVRKVGFRDAWDGLTTWLLARTPEIGYTLGLGAQIRVPKQEGHVWIRTPAITVLYEYTDDTVEIRAIHTP